MRRPSLPLVLVFFIVHFASCIAVHAADLPTTQQLLDQMTAKYTQIQTLEYDQRLGPETADKTGATITAHIVVEKFQKDGKAVDKTFSSGKMIDPGQDGKEAKTVEIRTVCDGTFIWMEERDARTGQTKVTKEPAQDIRIIDEMAAGFKRKVQAFALKVTGEDIIDGQKMYVLEGKYPPNPPTVASEKYWIGQDDLFRHRLVNTYKSDTKQQPTITTINSSNFKVNQPVDPKLFEYTPPAGAEIIDHTKPHQNADPPRTYSIPPAKPEGEGKPNE